MMGKQRRVGLIWCTLFLANQPIADRQIANRWLPRVNAPGNPGLHATFGPFRAHVVFHLRLKRRKGLHDLGRHGFRIGHGRFGGGMNRHVPFPQAALDVVVVRLVTAQAVELPDNKGVQGLLASPAKFQCLIELGTVGILGRLAPLLKDFDHINAFLFGILQAVLALKFEAHAFDLIVRADANIDDALFCHSV